MEHTVVTSYGTFSVDVAKEIEVNGELEWKMTYTPNQEIAPGGSIKILAPAYQHQRSEEYLQTYDYWKPNYIYAIGEKDETLVNVRIEKVPTAFKHINGWPDSSRIAIVYFEKGLKVGESVHVRFGGIDRPWIEGECAPSRVTQYATKVEGSYLEYEIAIDSKGTSEYQTVDVFPQIKIVAGKEEKVRVIAPGIVGTGEAFTIRLKVVDRFQNNLQAFDVSQYSVSIKNLKTGELKQLAKGERCTQVEEEGFYEVTVSNTTLDIEKAVILCDNESEKLYWGDIHIHSNLTANIRDNDCGASPRQGYLYAKETAALDYVAISEQTFKFNEDRSVNINQATWKEMGEEAEAYYEPDELVTLPGFELHGKRGDTVVLFKNALSQYPYPTEQVETIQDVWQFYKEYEIMSIPHLHRYCNGRLSLDQQDLKYGGFQWKNWEMNSEKEVLCEIFSSQWGRFENELHPMILKARANVEGNTVVDFLNKGKKWGMVANSDGHDGNPGYGGITGVYAESKTREGIFEALKARKTIASTHPRVIIKWDINGVTMGEVVRGHHEKRQLNIKVLAPTEIKDVEIIKNGVLFKKFSDGKNFFEDVVEDADKGIGDYYYIRIRLSNGHLAWASPIWIEE